MTLRVEAAPRSTPVSRVVLDGAAWAIVRRLVRVLPLPVPFHRAVDPATLPVEVRDAAVARLAEHGVLRQTDPPRLHASLQRSLLAHARPDAVLDLDLRRGDEIVVARYALLRDVASGLVWRPAVDGSDPALPVREVGTTTVVTTAVAHLLDDAVNLVPAPDATPSAREAGRERLVDAVAALGPMAGSSTADDGPDTPGSRVPDLLTRFAPLTGSMHARIGVPGQPAGDVRWLHDGHDWWEVEPRRDGQLALRPTGRDRLREVLLGGLVRRLGHEEAEA